MSDQPVLPNWYPDPLGRHEHRWFDGLFTTAAHDVVQIHRPLADPLRLTNASSAQSVDTAPKQDSRGFG